MNVTAIAEKALETIERLMEENRALRARSALLDERLAAALRGLMIGMGEGSSRGRAIDLIDPRLVKRASAVLARIDATEKANEGR